MQSVTMKPGLPEKRSRKTFEIMVAEGGFSNLSSAEDAYSVALERVKAMGAAAKRQLVQPESDSPATFTLKEELALAKRALAVAKACVLELKRRPPTPIARQFYPPPVEVPREEEDARFTRSFNIHAIMTCSNVGSSSPGAHKTSGPWSAWCTCRRKEACSGHAEATAAQDFFAEWGFVVFRDVISSSACEATRGEIWQTLESRTPGLNRGDPATYDLLSPKRYGLPDELAVFTPQVSLIFF